MLLRLLLRLWPALTPVLIYVLWVLLVERIIIPKILKKSADDKSKIIDGEYKVVGEKASQQAREGDFSLKNNRFLIALYASLILAIGSMIFFAISSPNKNPESYKPAQFKDGKILPAEIK